MSLETDIHKLASQVAQLTDELHRLKDASMVRRLQHAYGYYLDRCLYDEVVDLFAEDGEIRFMGGAFKGKAGVRRLYCDRFRKRFTGGHNGPVYGFLLDHLILQDVIDIAPDRKTALGRMRVFMQAGSHETRADTGGVLPSQWWEGGVYENEYVREDDVWKIKLLNYHLVYQGLFEDGWSHLKPTFSGSFKTTFPTDPFGPDELVEPKPVFWPDTEVVPFHYAHPVTGKMWEPG
jgi:SnoaL-like domain